MSQRSPFQKSNTANVFAKMIDISTWETLTSKTYTKHLGVEYKDKVIVKFEKTANKWNNKRACKISIGEDVMQQMRWQFGDKLEVLFNPEHILQWAIVPATIGKELRPKSKISKDGFLAIQWGNGLIEDFTAKIADFHVAGDALILEIKP